VVVGDERAHDGLAGFVVVPDRGGQCEDPRQDPGEDALVGAAAVSFEVKLAFEGLVDGLDDLAQRLEQVLAERPPAFRGLSTCWHTGPGR